MKNKREIEIAFGWAHNVFIIDSEGQMIEHPEFYVSCLDRLAYLNRKCARRLLWICKDCKAEKNKYRIVKKKKQCIECGSENIYKYCSKNWHKAKYTLAKYHEHIANKREYFIWHIVRYYADNYDIVTINKWPLKKQIEYSVDSKTARNLVDGAYGKFIAHLKFKCKELGKEFIERKDLQWQKVVSNAMEVAETEQLKKMIRETKKAIKWPNRRRLVFLKKESKRRAI